MTLAEELCEIAAILETPTSPFHREGGQLRSIAVRVALVEDRAERAERGPSNGSTLTTTPRGNWKRDGGTKATVATPSRSAP